MQYMHMYMAFCKIPLNFIWISASSESKGVSTETEYIQGYNRYKSKCKQLMTNNKYVLSISEYMTVFF